MRNSDPKPSSTPRHGDESTRAIKDFVLSGRFLVYSFFSTIGLCVVVVIGSIVLNAINNRGLIPPPNTLDRYECAGFNVPFTLHYLHGTDRIQIKSSLGLLEGTVRQNQLDWASFSKDSSMLGFLPPTDISFEDAKSLRISGPGYSDIRCAISVEHGSHRRAIVQ